MKKLLLVFWCFMFFISGCGLSHRRILFTENPSETRDNILRVIRRGTPVPDAKKTMEQYGFKCAMKKDKPFSANKQYYERLNYLYCDKERGIVVSRRWQVAFVYRKNAVTDVLVSTGLIGP